MRGKKKIPGGGDCAPPEVVYPDYNIDELNVLGNNTIEFTKKFTVNLLKLLCIFDNRHDFKPGRSVLTPAEVKNTLNPYVQLIQDEVSSSAEITVKEKEILMKLITIYKKCPMSKEIEPHVVDIIYNDILFASKLPEKNYSHDDTSILTNNTVVFEHEVDLITACGYDIQIRYDNGKPYVYPSNTDKGNILLTQIKTKIATDIDIPDIDKVKFCIDVSSIGKWVFQNNKNDNLNIIESIFDDYDHFKRKPGRIPIGNNDIQLCNGNLQLELFKVIQSGDINDLIWRDKDNSSLESKVLLSPDGDTAGVNKLSQAISAVIRSKNNPDAIDAYELIKKIFYQGLQDDVIKPNYISRSFDYKRIMDLGKLAFTLYNNRKFKQKIPGSNYVVLITHDRMLYALALCLRCPVIYVNIASGEETSRLIKPNIPSPNGDMTQHTVLSHPRKIEIRLPVKPNFQAIYNELRLFIEKIKDTFKNTYSKIESVIIKSFEFYKTLQDDIPAILSSPALDESNRKLRINIYLKKIIILFGNYVNYAISYINNIILNAESITTELEAILIEKPLEDSTNEMYKEAADKLKQEYDTIKIRYNIKYNYIDKSQIDEEINNINKMINSFTLFIDNLNTVFAIEATEDIDKYIKEQPNIHNRVINEYKRTFKIQDYKVTYHIHFMSIFNELFKNCDLRRTNLPKMSHQPFLNNLNNMLNIIKTVSQLGGGEKRKRSESPEPRYSNKQYENFRPKTPEPRLLEPKKPKITYYPLLPIEDIYGDISYNVNNYAVHLLNHSIEKELERFQYIEDDKIEAIITENREDILNIMIYKIHTYQEKSYYYASILNDMLQNGDIATGKENDTVKELCQKLLETITNKNKMIQKFQNIYHIEDKNIDYRLLSLEKPIKKEIINIMQRNCLSVPGGGKNAPLRYKFYNVFLKEFKKSLKVK